MAQKSKCLLSPGLKYGYFVNTQKQTENLMLKTKQKQWTKQCLCRFGDGQLSLLVQNQMEFKENTSLCFGTTLQSRTYIMYDINVYF